jgi:RNA recognition motif-containing protein
MNKASSSSSSTPLAYAPGSGSDAKKHTVFVSNLPEDVDEESLLNVFVTFGEYARFAFGFGRWDRLAKAFGAGGRRG